MAWVIVGESHAQDLFPKFSWDTTPVYYMFGDRERVLTADEIKFIAARTDFLCIEKSHGWGELGAAELGAKHDTAAFKKANPDIKVCTVRPWRRSPIMAILIPSIVRLLSASSLRMVYRSNKA